MEVRGQDKVIGMPTTLDYNPPNRVGSSSKLSSPALPSSEIRRIDQTALGLAHGNNTIFIQSQTLDPHHHPHHLSSVDHHHNQPQPLNPQPPPLKPRRDPDPNPDPIPSPIVVCTPSATPTTTAIPSGSNSFKAPPAAPPTPASKSVRYRECLRNHAASSGGHVLDGCGEFMPSSCTAEEEDNPEALKCAACECHRNFHRKEVEGGGGDDHHYNYYIYNHNKNNITSRRDHYYSVPAVPPQQALHPPPPPQHHPIRHHPHQYHHHQQNPPMMMAFGGGGGGGGTAAESSSEDLNINVYQSNYAAAAGQLARKKRFRTKFSQEQKEKMMGLAEKLGWRIQKHDEEEVQQLCAQVGIKRQVFKVWMHNNKQAMKKKEAN